MFYKRTSFREGKEQVNKLKIDLCPIKEPVLEKKKNRLIGKE
jgi:hypothetical protein